MSRRLLLVSYHFGEGSGTGGLRWNAMAKYLGAADWEVDVIAAARVGAEAPYEFAPGVCVTPVPVPTWLGDAVRAAGRIKRRLLRRLDVWADPAGGEPVAASTPGLHAGPQTKIYSKITSNVDAVTRWSAEAGWAWRAAGVGSALALKRSPDLVLVNGPPHPTHLAGVRLSKVLGIPYVADFRDPWVYAEWDAAESALLDVWLGRWAQELTFMAATRLTFNTIRAAEAAEGFDPRLIGRTAAIPNGYDPRGACALPDPGLFRVAFVGLLYSFMDPEPVLAACARLRKRAQLRSLRVEFVGTGPVHDGISLIARARAHGLEDCFQHHPRVPREEALRIQEQAAVQVVFDTPGPLRIPMKFYDCAQMYGDLLIIGQRASALGDAAARLGCAVCPPADPGTIDAVLDRALERWRNRAYDAPLDQTGLFSRAHASLNMRRLLDGLVLTRPAGASRALHS